MNRRGNTHHFSGITINMSGGDDVLDSFIDELEYVSGVEVIARSDAEEGCEVLILQARMHARPRIIKIAIKAGLTVA